MNSTCGPGTHVSDTALGRAMAGCTHHALEQLAARATGRRLRACTLLSAWVTFEQGTGTTYEHDDLAAEREREARAEDGDAVNTQTVV